LQGERHGALLEADSKKNDDRAFVDRVRFVEGKAGRVFLTRGGHLVRVAEDSCDIVWQVSLNQVVEEGNAQGTWFSVTLVDTELVCLSRSGAIVTVDPSSGDRTLVGEFEHGIHSGAWSPDREILVLVTLAEPEQDGTNGAPSSALLCMTPDFQVLAELPMEPHEVKEDVHVIWRPDGTLLGISSVDQADHQRKIRIYQREPFQLSALGRSEDGSGKLVANIQSTPLAWAGPGCSQLMACIIPKGRKDMQVALLEPNGLRHGQFLLRLDDTTHTSVQGIVWNAASDLLMVHVREHHCDEVQLWTRSNYHWYLKWSRRFYERCSGIKFDEEDACLVDILLQTGEWREYKFRWETSSVDSNGTAIVVDGNQLLLTPLEKALVPPPMSAATLSLPSSISDIVVDGTHSSVGETLFAVILLDGKIAIFSGQDTSANSMVGHYSPPALRALAPLPEGTETWRSWSIVGNDTPDQVHFIAVQVGSRYTTERLIHFVVSWSNFDQQSSDARVEVKKVLPLENRLLAAVPWADDANGVLLELSDGDLFEYSVDDETIKPLEDSGALLEPCPWIAGLKHPGALGSGELHRQRLVIGMSERGRLFCHDLLLFDSVSSFILDRKHGFLCFATSESRCELRFIPLVGLVNFDPLSGLDETLPLLQGYEPRHVERGARLVASLETPSVVLQMPRGNLEGIFPRALVLQHCMRQIHVHQFGPSFELMRRQKVDTNLIVDMDPIVFLKEGAVELVEQIQNIDHLNLFISTLQNWDSTTTRYHIPFWSERTSRCAVLEEFDFTNKVNFVCQCLRSVLIQAEEKGETLGGRKIPKGHFLLPILSTFAKENPPQLEQALALIKSKSLEAHVASSRKPPLFSDVAQHSIQYLAFLADYDHLFDTALGMYDYDIARAVARNSQMDPKFYLPLLKHYRDLPKFYGRYEVDLRLKRFVLALQNLFESGKCGEVVSSSSNRAERDQGDNGFERCFELIKEYNLHSHGLKLFKEIKQQNKIILHLGDTLLNSKPDEALNIFSITRPLDHERVMKAARACWDWRVFFTHAFPQGMNHTFANNEDASIEIETSKRQILVRNIAEELEASAQGGSNKRKILHEASRLLLDYASDVVEAVEVLLRGQWWEEARRIATMHGRVNLHRKCVESAFSYAATSIEECRERTKTFTESSNRYEEVLQIRKNAYASGEVDALGLVAGNQPDETGSMFSAASQASNLSNLSRGSTGSTGSVGSISTVISAKSSTSFSLSGADETTRHKSKYNDIGKKNKKRNKRKNKGRAKTVPGSEQEVLDLVERLRDAVPDEDSVNLIGETIIFLCQEQQLRPARELFTAVTESCEEIRKCQVSRTEREVTRGKEYLKENPGQEIVTHPSENIVNLLHFPALPTTVLALMKYVTILDSN